MHGYRNLFDATLLLTPNTKFNAYVNFDFGTNHDAIVNGTGDTNRNYLGGHRVCRARADQYRQCCCPAL